ncbi:MAG TPA: PH domain-containing protein [Arenimonas sp.]|uniref:PH domain-containing protein n=1 Tax=Arenimonas sp. TaxID=1872635 RepID=UPI002BA4E317|nr:PH domain-containing protein [Arenimonas sp.]HMB57387.1 PH domain-containing protein [Arenimonas sp.]
MTTQEFAIVPPGKFARMFPLFIGLVLPLAMLTAMVLAAKGSRDWLYASPALLIMPLTAGMLAWTMHRRTIQVSDQGIVVRRFPWPRMIKLAELDLAQAGIVNLDERLELQPIFKIAGSALPGYRSGLFRLRDRRRATVLLTDWKRVLVLPKRDGSVILLSPQRPDALLEALRNARG